DLGQSGIAGLLTPVIDQSEQYCVEFCNECNKVCPTGAIAHLTLDEKRHVSIGLAEVTRSRCIAWNEGAHCMVCQEYCPYLAIRAEVHNGVNCPVVDPEMCRGCGTCHNQCPALPDKAINIHGIRQKKAKPLPTFGAHLETAGPRRPPGEAGRDGRLQVRWRSSPSSRVTAKET
ncbi:MAG: 4Fe-4S binding protein, partial [Kiritimatiellae bacterium]|nr:4Fe-4S binding protein [Kiritimatiellia bacterium]